MSTTARKAGPSFRRVVMSLKRIPSVGTSLMSLFLARSSATFMPAPMVIDAPHTPQEPTLRTQRGAVMFALYHCGHGKEVRTPMRFTMIPVLGLVLALSASPAFAFGGGGGHDAAAASSGSPASGGSAASGSTRTGAQNSAPRCLFHVGL